MKIKIVNDLNFVKQARELKVNIWQTPSFLFLMVGIIAVAAMTATYYISRNYDNPELVVISESVVVILIFSVGNSIIKSFEQVNEINKMKSEFISIASHQLRMPISAINWETEIILSKFKKGMNQKQISAVETIRSLSVRMTRLVNDLLDVTRIEQSRMVLKNEKVSLPKLTEDLLKNFKSLIGAKNIRIIFDPSKNRNSLCCGDREKTKLVPDCRSFFTSVRILIKRLLRIWRDIFSTARERVNPEATITLRFLVKRSFSLKGTPKKRSRNLIPIACFFSLSNFLKEVKMKPSPLS